ncbi:MULTISPECIES: hypothetical protein [Streptomyces]|uniref:hypothetical protein n=1 Tax=Streptomyces TaxID=1883 RepID=UPI0007CD9D83|nr:hypothetical protein A4V12_06035 [Streptomyces noursei]
MSHSAQEPIDRIDERGAAASALACLDRCLPLLGSPPDGLPDDLLRPLWHCVAEGGADWTDRLAEVRARVADAVDAGAGQGPAAAGPAGAVVRDMLAAAPSGWEGAALRAWAGVCAAAALDVHERLGGGPLADGEERRQAQILDFLADAPAAAAGLRPVLEVSAEGRRVLRAVVSRRGRGA